ncbi:hypothetical protein TNCV_1835911 [Trichonephila clavipes]|nr:hypothetical protein TNCV_1835911 [Trichonephila clavipes]
MEEKELWAPFRQSSVSSIRGTVFVKGKSEIPGSSDSLFLSVRHLTRMTSLTNNSSVTRSFLLVIKQPDVSEITHRCPSFSGSKAWPMHIPLGMIWFRNCRLVTEHHFFRFDMWIPWTV